MLEGWPVVLYLFHSPRPPLHCRIVLSVDEYIGSIAQIQPLGVCRYLRLEYFLISAPSPSMLLQYYEVYSVVRNTRHFSHFHFSRTVEPPQCVSTNARRLADTVVLQYLWLVLITEADLIVQGRFGRRQWYWVYVLPGFISRYDFHVYIRYHRCVSHSTYLRNERYS